MDNLTALKQEVLRVSKLAYSEGLFAGTSGNLSARDRESGLIVITPTSLPYDTMTVDDIVVLDANGGAVQGSRKPSSEWRMHLEIYRGRDDVVAIVHTHSPYATGFAVTRKKIPLILIEMVPFLGGDVPIAEFAMPGSVELGLAALRALDKRNACLLANHGVVAVGDSLEEAHLRAIYTEDAATIYHHALGAGEIHLVPEDAVRRMQEQQTRR